MNSFTTRQAGYFHNYYCCCEGIYRSEELHGSSLQDLKDEVSYKLLSQCPEPHCIMRSFIVVLFTK
jgi:hypothetical protein